MTPRPSRRPGRAACLAHLLGALAWLGCASTIPAPDPVPADPEAERMLEEWLVQSRGFDALEAYELRGLGAPVRFGVARKWSTTSVKVLSWTLSPAAGIGYLLLHERNRLPEVFVYLPAGSGRFSGRVSRISGAAPLPGDGSALSLASEVARVAMPGDFLAVRRGQEAVAGKPCDVIEGRPARPSRGLTHLRWWIEPASGVAMRKVYYNGEQELRRVDVVPESMREFEGRTLPHAWRIQTADGTEAEIVLRNVVLDIALPDSLFRQHTLEAQRFPQF